MRLENNPIFLAVRYLFHLSEDERNHHPFLASFHPSNFKTNETSACSLKHAGKKPKKS